MPNLEGQPLVVRYPNILLDGNNPLRIHRTATPEQMLDVASDIQGLLRDNFTKMFASGDEPVVPRSAVEAYFNPDNPVLVGEQASNMQQWTETQSSQYWVASVPEGEDSTVVGMLKVSPSRPRLLARVENMYINDVLVTPAMQRRKVGTAMLRTAIRFGGYHQDARLVGDVFTRNAGFNQYVTDRLGMVAGGVSSSFEIAGVRLPQRRVVMRRTWSIGKLVERMERNTPELLDTE